MMVPRLFLLMTIIGLTCGCTSKDDAARHDTPRNAVPLTPPSTGPVSQTGTLRGGMMAIGGETSGWTLVGDGAVGGLELDVSRVQEAARRLDGKRVTATGRMVDKKYVERGTVRVLQVETLKEAR